MDDKLRKLERLASQGDIEAMGKLHLERYRLGLPLLPSVVGKFKYADGQTRDCYYWSFSNGLEASLILHKFLYPGDDSGDWVLTDWAFNHKPFEKTKIGPFMKSLLFEGDDPPILNPKAQEYLVKMMLYGR